MDCLFCGIIEGKVPSTKVFEDDQVYAFRDISPQGPVHLLVVSKKHIPTVNDIAPEDEALVGHMLRMAGDIAAAEGIASDGYRLVFNTNRHGCQTVYHIHLHLVGGRQLGWPPG